MLNIGKLDSGKAEYYLNEVASGVEDYYLHAGEAPGVWRGAAAEELGLRGQVEAEQLLAVLAGVHPGTGQRLAFSQRGGERVPGFDLTFRAPKSVSLAVLAGRVRRCANRCGWRTRRRSRRRWGSWSAKRGSGDGGWTGGSWM